MISGTQRYSGSSGKKDRLTTKRTRCGSVRDHEIEEGLVELVRDVARGMEGDKCGDVLEAIETLWKSEKELKGGIRRGHASATEAPKIHFY